MPSSELRLINGIILKSVVKIAFSHMVLADAIISAQFLLENQLSPPPAASVF